jgi:hypothetical protein
MRTGDISASQYDRPMRIALIVGLAAGLVSVAGLFISGPGQFFQAYLFSFMFWIGISLGSLALLLLHILAGNRWGLAIRRIVEAAAGNTGLMAVLFIPLLFGLSTLFTWARPADVAASPALQLQAWYLNLPFFIGRAVLYFVVWIGLATLANRLISRQAAAAAAGNPYSANRQGLGGLGLIAYVLTMTFAAVDWMMSLQPFWSSSVYGLLVIFGQVLTSLAFSVLVLNLFPGLGLGRSWTHDTTPIPFRDLGAMMMTLVMGWAYLAYFQLLIIWAGNLPHEVSWYIARTQGGWSVVAILVVVFQFVLPFLMLVSMKVRHNLRILAWLGGALLLANLVNLFWQVKPAFYPGFAISWLDIVMPFAIGGLWVAGFLYMLKRRPVMSASEQESLNPVSEQSETLSKETQN